MRLKKEDILITHYLTGFHAFRKDHNYVQYRGNLINDISASLDNVILDQFDQGPQTILKSAQRNDLFEIKLSANLLTYQDSLEFEALKSNSLQLLKLWQAHSSIVELRLVGMVILFSISQDIYNSIDLNYFLSDPISKWPQIKTLDAINFSFNFTTEIDSSLYNGQIHIIQNNNSKFPFIGSLDINLTSGSIESPIKLDEIDAIFNNGFLFFNNQLFEILNNNL